jgi:hypothetical protein
MGMHLSAGYPAASLVPDAEWGDRDARAQCAVLWR